MLRNSLEFGSLGSHPIHRSIPKSLEGQPIKSTFLGRPSQLCRLSTVPQVLSVLHIDELELRSPCQSMASSSFAGGDLQATSAAVPTVTLSSIPQVSYDLLLADSISLLCILNLRSVFLSP